MRLLHSLLLIPGLLLVFNCGARWKAKQFSPEDRDDWQQPERVIQELNLRPGQSVADVGAGGGYFTFRLSEAVGDGGSVIAVDLDPGMLELIKEEAANRGASNVRLQLGRAADPDIPAPVDLIFMVNTYHHIEDPATYFRTVRRHLKPGGRVAIIDFHKAGFFHGLLGHGAETEGVAEALRQAGYRSVGRFDYLSNQHFQIFTPEE